jgi:hypothetical protein
VSTLGASIDLDAAGSCFVEDVALPHWF